MDKCMCWMGRCQDVAPLVLRIAVGLVFFMHGWQKLTLFKVEGTTALLTGLGFPAAGFLAVVLIAAELLGGLALILGLFTHWAAKIVGVVAIVALFAVHFEYGFFLLNTDGGVGYEYTLVLFAAAVSLMMTGAGKYSLDAKFFKKKETGDSMT